MIWLSVPFSGMFSWCNVTQIVLRDRHIPGPLNVIADKLSRHRQVIQIELSLLQAVFDHLCFRWHTSHLDLFPTRLKNNSGSNSGSNSESLGIYLFGVLHRFQHCTGHITTGSWKGRGNQYIQFVRVL